MDAPFISIHAPREGGDRDFKNMDKRVVISIHAPREGGDFHQFFPVYYRFHFNPRPPRGGRLFILILSPTMPPFQSTPPARGATINFLHLICNFLFQSTPPARGATTPYGKIRYH